jgi:hypothetical protein
LENASAPPSADFHRRRGSLPVARCGTLMGSLRCGPTSEF